MLLLLLTTGVWWHFCARGWHPAALIVAGLSADASSGAPNTCGLVTAGSGLAGEACLAGCSADVIGAHSLAVAAVPSCKQSAAAHAQGRVRGCAVRLI
jgi:phage terminase large subunit-like protein